MGPSAGEGQLITSPHSERSGFYSVLLMHCSPEVNPRLHLRSHRLSVLDESEAAQFEWYFIEGKGIKKTFHSSLIQMKQQSGHFTRKMS